MTQLRSRLEKLEASIPKPGFERINWLCARVPADAPQSKLDALALEAEKRGCAFRSYSYDGPPDYPGKALPELYVLHTLQETPARYANEFVRKARNDQHS